MASASVARGATIVVTLDPDFSKYHYYSFTDAQGGTNGEYIGPYPATISGGSFGSGQAVYLFCHDINVPTPIGVNFAGVLTRPLSEVDILVAYLEDQVFQAGGYSADIDSIAGQISMAVWQLENPSSVYPAPFALDPRAAAWIAQAQAAYQSGAWTAADAAKYAIWIPDVLTQSQRFGLLDGPSPDPSDFHSPEPASHLLLVGGGVLLFFGWRRRR